ncbi:hypothetical protein CEXT_489461, partial [Caerostris extrusa]
MEINLVTRYYFKFLFCGAPLTNIDLQNKIGMDFVWDRRF